MMEFWPVVKAASPMKITHIRNATLLLTVGQRRILVDPMLSEPGTQPGFRLVGGERRRNPLVPLPPGAQQAMDQADCVLITHEHPDHLDKPAVEWIKSRDLPVWASSIDAPNLKRKGLRAKSLPSEEFGCPVEVIPGRHGHGLIGWLMGPVSAFYFAFPDQPSIFLTGDTVLSEAIRASIERLKPEIVVAPAGAANFGMGRDLLFGIDELETLVGMTRGQVVFNHLEAIDHCPTQRSDLRRQMEAAGWGERVAIPADGEELEYAPQSSEGTVQPGDSPNRSPNFQKWLTAKFAGT